MNIAIASGKGGTGKTTLALSLASWCAREGLSVALLDCEVEEPNADLLLKSSILSVDAATVPVPVRIWSGAPAAASAKPSVNSAPSCS